MPKSFGKRNCKKSNYSNRDLNNIKINSNPNRNQIQNQNIENKNEIPQQNVSRRNYNKSSIFDNSDLNQLGNIKLLIYYK